MKTKLLVLFCIFITAMALCTYCSLYEWNSEMQHHLLKAVLLLTAGLIFVTGAIITFSRMNRQV
ncbi:hypothetical protein ACE38W_22085 [Chitinophaga sp. Hz27]|uniref:hypothetical protein n=1 Tax=Chitinophaga sp. Hz27 TaxID=3347169 RepID=UPI0035DD0330